MKIADHRAEQETATSNSAHMLQLREYGWRFSVGGENYQYIIIKTKQSAINRH